MSDTEGADRKPVEFIYNIDKSGRAKCRARSCKQKITKGTLRITKEFDSAMGGSEDTIRMSHHHHPECFFREVNVNARKHIIENSTDIEDYDTLTEEQKKEMDGLAEESMEIRNAPNKAAAKKAALARTGEKRAKESEESEESEEVKKPARKKAKAVSKKEDKKSPKKTAKKKATKKKESESSDASEPEFDSE